MLSQQFSMHDNNFIHQIKRVQQFTYPFSACVRIQIIAQKFQELSYFAATGFFIDLKHILTTAQVFSNPSVANRKIEIYCIFPGDHLQNEQKIRIAKYKFPDQYLVCEGKQKILYDYALLRIPQQYEHLIKSFIQTDFSKNNLKQIQMSSSQIAVVGFPAQGFDTVRNQSFKEEEMHVSNGKYTKIREESTLQYKFQTEKGFAGGPVLQIRKGSEVAVAINLNKLQNQYKEALILSPNVQNHINAWKKQFNSNCKCEKDEWLQCSFHIKNQELSRVQAIKYPYTAIGLIQSNFSQKDQKFDQKVSFGTGFLIAQRIVLTAAHNFYNIKFTKQVLIKNISFRLPHTINEFEQQNGSFLSKEIKILKYFYPKQYETDPSSQNDYAILILSPEASNYEKKYLEVDFSHENHHLLQDNFKQLVIAGYPTKGVDKHQNEVKFKQLYISKGRVDEFIKTKISYLIDTEPGHSGSPVFAESNDGKMTVIGIHRYGDIKSYNHATRLQPHMKSKIQGWIQQVGLELPKQNFIKDVPFAENNQMEIQSQLPNHPYLIDEQIEFIQKQREEIDIYAQSQLNELHKVNQTIEHFNQKRQELLLKKGQDLAYYFDQKIDQLYEAKYQFERQQNFDGILYIINEITSLRDRKQLRFDTAAQDTEVLENGLFIQNLTKYKNDQSFDSKIQRSYKIYQEKTLEIERLQLRKDELQNGSNENYWRM